MKSDSDTGQLKYKRPTTTEDLRTFLTNQGIFDEGDISAAIDKVAKASSDSLPATTNDTRPAPGTSVTSDDQANPPQRKKYSNDDATDVEARYGPRSQLPAPSARLQAPTSATLDTTKPHGGKKPGEVSQSSSAIQKRASRAEVAKARKSGSAAFSQMASHLSKRPVKEAFVDDQGSKLSERDVEQVFAELTNAPAAAPAQAADTSNTKKDELNQLKRAIRDTMTDRQRRALWRALTNA